MLGSIKKLGGYTLKYVVIEYRNPAMDACAHHPSQIATMSDGGDPWPVTATCVSRLYDTQTEAFEMLKQKFTERKSDLKNRVCHPWVIVEAYHDTLFVCELDIDQHPKMHTSEWVFKMEVLCVPETNEEAT